MRVSNLPPGQAGPGRPKGSANKKTYAERCRKMVEQRGPEVFDEIFAGDNPALKLETIKHLTAYGWGRPAQSVTVTHKAAGDVIMEAIERADRLRSEANITVAN